MAPNKKPARKLTSQEEHLWALVTKDVAKLNRVEAPMSMEQLMAGTAPVGARALAPSQLKPPKKPLLENRKNTPYTSKVVQEPQSSIFAQGDPAMERRVARGRMRIDACLDLHGHTQVEAQQRLQAFITLACHQGARCVLVVTGKGRESERTRLQDIRRQHARTDEASSPFDMQHAPRGVLRTRFLEWVEQSPLREHIIRVSRAKPRDGGTGAFYVFLKKS